MIKPIGKLIGRGVEGRSYSLPLAPVVSDFTIENLAGERTRPYRTPGQLEIADPTIEPLPATPITDAALKRLQGWGMSDSVIDELRDQISSFRYDLVTQRVQRLAATGGYVVLKNAIPIKIVLPKVFDHGDNGLLSRDGECATLVAQALTDWNSTGYLRRVNTTLSQQGRPPIRPYYRQGQSPTHYNLGRSLHTWIDLLSEGSDISDMVTVDPSSQIISTADSHNYIPDPLEQAPIQAHNSALIEVCDYIPSVNSDGPLLFSPKQTLVVGASSDRVVTYEIGFSVEKSNKRIHPFVVAREANGKVGLSYVIGNNNNPYPIEIAKENYCTDTHREEMKEIVLALNTMSLVPDALGALEAWNDIVPLHVDDPELWTPEIEVKTVRRGGRLFELFNK